MNHLLSMEKISKNFRDGDATINVLDHVSLAIASGELIAVVGPSGSGKSTFLSIAGALLSPSGGTVSVDRENITRCSRKKRTQIRLDKIGFIFQSAHLIPYLSVRDQLLLIARIARQNKKEAGKRADRLLNHLGIAHRAKDYPETLSGGEKQRVAIARALMNGPKLILADEPTASLDYERGRSVVNLIAGEVRAERKAAVMVTHDERMLDLCDRVMYLENGRLIEKRS